MREIICYPLFMLYGRCSTISSRPATAVLLAAVGAGQNGLSRQRNGEIPSCEQLPPFDVKHLAAVGADEGILGTFDLPSYGDGDEYQRQQQRTEISKNKYQNSLYSSHGKSLLFY